MSGLVGLGAFDGIFAQNRRPQNSRVALAIGNGQYSDAPLHNPVNDARAMGAALEGAGFAVQFAFDADEAQMERSASAFYSKIKRDSIALFYYAGHGMQIEGQNYLLPINTRSTNAIEIKYHSLIVDEVLEKMAEGSPVLSIVILDACRDNPFGFRRSGVRGLGSDLKFSGAELVLYSTSPGQTAEDSPESTNSLFTSALLRAVQQPGLNLTQIISQVQDQVSEESSKVQQPWFSSNAGGAANAFYFSPPSSPELDPFSQVLHTTVAGPLRDKYALVVGISKIRSSEDLNLHGRVDAADLADILVDPNFGRFRRENVKLLLDEDATTSNIKQAMALISTRARSNDLVVMYFSSLSVPRELDPVGAIYLLTWDSNPSTPATRYATAMSIVDIAEFARKRLLADRSIILLDASHSGPGSFWLESGQITAEKPVSEMPQRGRVFISACREDEVAFNDVEGRNSYFMHYVLEALRSSRGRLSGLDLYNYVAARLPSAVMRETGRRQHPVLLMGGIEAPYTISQVPS
ncbi:MAG: caspase family protein [Acidobacteriia bacterium]|nr:caspase family protein [Terriglobia bacterium]